MDRRRLTRFGLAAALAAACILPGTGMAEELPRNVRLVIGSSSTGGDTYQNASIVAEALSAHLGINVKVDAVGIAEALRATKRDPRGTTLMFHHDQTYLGNLYGVRGYADMFADYQVGPTLSINPGNAYLVPKKSPYRSIDDLLAAAAKGERIRVAIQPGGVSEIGLSALKNAARLKNPGSEKNIVAVNTGSQADKNQLLFDGQAEVINGSVQANEQFTRLPADDQKAMRFIWITASHETIAEAPEAGIGELDRTAMLEYVAPNADVPMDEGKKFTFDKVFFLLYHKDMSKDLVAAIDKALDEIYAKGEIQEKQKASFFIPRFLPSEKAATWLKERNDDYAKVIKAISAE